MSLAKKAGVTRFYSKSLANVTFGSTDVIMALSLKMLCPRSLTQGHFLEVQTTTRGLSTDEGLRTDN